MTFLGIGDFFTLGMVASNHSWSTYPPLTYPPDIWIWLFLVGVRWGGLVAIAIIQTSEIKSTSRLTKIMTGVAAVFARTFL